MSDYLRENCESPFSPDMPDQNTEFRTHPIHANERRITLGDGRYMVFFTFSDQGSEDAAGEAAASSNIAEDPPKEDGNV